MSSEGLMIKEDTMDFKTVITDTYVECVTIVRSGEEAVRRNLFTTSAVRRLPQFFEV